MCDVSTGMASVNEIEEAVTTAKNYSSKDILLFHCVSAYPAPIKEANLKNLVFLKKNLMSRLDSLIIRLVIRQRLHR